MLARLASSTVTAYARARSGLQNAYQHFRKHAPRALYRSIDSCSNYREAEANIGQFWERSA
jgi:hypothetical protein